MAIRGKDAARAAQITIALVLLTAAVPAPAQAIPAARDVSTRATHTLERGTVSVRIIRRAARRHVVNTTLLVTAVRRTRAVFAFSACASGSRGKCGTVRESDVFVLDRGRSRIQRVLRLPATSRPCARVALNELRGGREIALIALRERAVRVCLP